LIFVFNISLKTFDFLIYCYVANIGFNKNIYRVHVIKLKDFEYIVRGEWGECKYFKLIPYRSTGGPASI
jgi:hypothetical protein